jgi:hypothetical protein
VGALVLLEIGFQRSISSDAITSITDSQGNTWTEVRTLQQRGATVFHAIWACTLSRSWSTSDSVTITYSFNVVRNGHVALLDAFTNATLGETGANPAGSSGTALDQRYVAQGSHLGVGQLFIVEIEYTNAGGLDGSGLVTVGSGDGQTVQTVYVPTGSYGMRLMHRPAASVGDVIGFVQSNARSYTGGYVVLVPGDYVEPTPYAPGSKLVRGGMTRARGVSGGTLTVSR